MIPIALPSPALLVSRSTHVDQGASRALEQSATHVRGGEHPSPKAKFADALRTAESPRPKPSAQPQDAADPKPARSNAEAGEENSLAQAQPSDENSVLEESSAKADSPQSVKREAGENTHSVTDAVPAARDSVSRSIVPASPSVSGTQSPPTQIDQAQVQSQMQNQQPASEPPPDRANSSPRVDNRWQQPAPGVAEATAQSNTRESRHVVPSRDEQSAIQQHNQPPQPQPRSHGSQAQLANEVPEITEAIARPQAARQPTVAHTILSSQPEPAVDRRSPRASAGKSPAQTAGLAGAQHSVEVEADSQRTTPAVARAVQVDAAVRVQNAMAQAAPGEQVVTNNAPALPTTHQLTLAPAPHPKSDNVAQHLPALSAPIDDSPLTGQVVRGLSARVNQRGGTMNLRLDPPDLGQLRIQMTVARGVVTAEFHPTTPQAHELLERNLAALRSTLEGQGLTVERLNVHVAAPSGQNQMMRDDSNANTPNQHRQHHDAAGGESRGRRDGQAQQEFHREYAFADFQNLLKDLDHFALR